MPSAAIDLGEAGSTTTSTSPRDRYSTSVGDDMLLLSRVVREGIDQRRAEREDGRRRWRTPPSMKDVVIAY